MAEVPVLETPRLRLRRHRPDDLDAATAMWADPLVTRFIGGLPFSKADTWARLLRYAGHWQWFGYGFWAVEERESGAFVGDVGFADFKRDLDPPLGDTPEMGWSLASAIHGRGYATEAIQAALAWADARFEGQPTACMIDPGNTASIRVALRSGFVETRKALYKGHPTLLFERAGASSIALSTSARAATN